MVIHKSTTTSLELHSTNIKKRDSAFYIFYDKIMINIYLYNIFLISYHHNYIKSGVIIKHKKEAIWADL